MLIIRLQRAGTKNKPAYRVVLAESYRSASKQVQEVLGSYNPKTKVLVIKNEERLKKLLALNTKVSPSVYNLFVQNKLVDGKKVKAWRPKVKESAPGAASTPSETTTTPSAGATEEPKAPETPAA
jgi:small subunit ribosomal protein S16